MKESRLHRSHASYLLQTAKEVAGYCDTHNIKYGIDFHGLTQPDEAAKFNFSKVYTADAFPKTDLPKLGKSTIVVFESKYRQPETTLHGELVAAVADTLGKGFDPGVETIYVHASLNPNLRKITSRI